MIRMVFLPLVAFCRRICSRGHELGLTALVGLTPVVGNIIPVRRQAKS